MRRFLLLTILAAFVLAEPETEPAEMVAEREEDQEQAAELGQEGDLDQESESQQEPGVKPRYLEDSPEDVVGGNVAKPNSWPWQVSLQGGSGSTYRHFCGGTLIKKNWVMTAAHCVDRPGLSRVVAGEHDLQTSSGREQNLNVARVYIHPRWNAKRLSSGYDIALLRLSSDAQLNKYVALGSLPQPGQILPNKNPCYITGWGRTSTGGSPSLQLKQALLHVVDYDTCSRADWWGRYVKREMVCAGGGALSACNGDSGGPLNCQVSGKYYVHGVASFVSTLGCNTPKKPTIFTRVSAYISWMKSVMGGRA